MLRILCSYSDRWQLRIEIGDPLMTAFSLSFACIQRPLASACQTHPASELEMLLENTERSNSHLRLILLPRLGHRSYHLHPRLLPRRTRPLLNRHHRSPQTEGLHQ